MKKLLDGFRVVEQYCSATTDEKIGESLRDNGYVLLPQAISREATDAARKAMDEMLVGAGWASRLGESGHAVPADDAWSTMTPDSYQSVFQQMWTHDSITKICHDQSLLTTVGRALGTEQIFVHPFKVLRIRLPSRLMPVPVGFHQDYPEFQGSPNQLTCWFALSNMMPEDGSLPIVAGSHREGVRDLKLANQSHAGWEAVFDDDLEVHLAPVRAGDVLAFTTYTVHGRAHKSTSSVGYSVDCRYQPDRDPVCSEVLNMSGHISQLEELVEALQDVPDHQLFDPYWIRQSLETVEFDRRYERWRETTAIEKGKAGDHDALRALAIVASQSSSEHVRTQASSLLLRLQG